MTVRPAEEGEEQHMSSLNSKAALTKVKMLQKGDKSLMLAPTMCGLEPQLELAQGVSSITGTFDFTKRELTLVGTGAASLHQFCPIFENRVFLNGLLFDFKTMVGPALAESLSYNWCQQFRIEIDASKDLNNVVVRHADMPEGQRIELVWLGRQQTESSIAADTNVLKNVGIPPKAMPLNDAIRARWGDAFLLSTNTLDTAVHVEFDRHYLEMETSYIAFGEIHWRFRALRVGMTNVSVVRGADKGPRFTKRIEHEVDISVGDN